MLGAYLGDADGVVPTPTSRWSPATTSWPTPPTRSRPSSRPGPAQHAGHADRPERHLAARIRRRGRRPSCGDQLLGLTRHDLVFLAGHFSANSALAADFTTSMSTTELAASTTTSRTRSCSAPAATPATTSSTRRHARRDRTARLGAGVRPEARDADRRHRLPVRRHRLHRVQRADLRRLRPPAARRARAGVGRPGARSERSRPTSHDTPSLRGIDRRRCSRRRCSACRCSASTCPARPHPRSD